MTPELAAIRQSVEDVQDDPEAVQEIVADHIIAVYTRNEDLVTLWNNVNETILDDLPPLFLYFILLAIFGIEIDVRALCSRIYRKLAHRMLSKES